MSRPTDRLRGIRMAIAICQQHTFSLPLFDDEHEELWIDIENACAFALFEELGCIRELKAVRA